MNIHPTAIVSSEAKISEGVEIGPYSIIDSDVRIGRNTIIGPHVVIKAHTDIGEGCRFFQFASIGEVPQDLKFKGEETRVVIGNHNTIREFVTIHRATTEDTGVTSIGDHNLIMAYCHVAHNCKLGDHIVMANAANLGGHVHVEDFAIISGLTGNFAKLYGLNVIGLKRRGFKEETIMALKETYKIIFRSSLLLSDALERVRREFNDIPEVRHFIDFIQNSERGICR
jgi:UDP-N-acetylglucosamine acyltransferase